MFWDDEQWHLGDDATVVATSASATYLPPVVWDHAAVTRTALDKCGVPTLKHLLSCVGLPAPTPKDWVISILHHCASSLLRFFSGQETYIALLQEHQRSPVPSSDLCMLLSQTLASYSFCTDSNVLAEVDFVAQTGHSSLLPLQDVFLFLRLLLVTSKSDIVAHIPSGHASVH